MRAGVGLVCAGVLLAACGSAAGPAATPSPTRYVATPTPLPTPTPNPHDLVQQYIAVLTRDLAPLPDVAGVCRSFTGACVDALNKGEAVAKAAHEDLRQLYAEPASVAPVIEGIRNGLEFGFNGFAGAVQSGVYSLQHVVDFYEAARHGVIDGLARLKAEAP